MYADGVATCDQGAVADRSGGGGKADTPAMPDGYGKAAGDSGKDVPERKNNDMAVNEIRVIMSEEVEALSG